MHSIQKRLQDQVRIVMIDTSHPGNIGAAARAIKNMGHRQLYLVNPKQFPHSEATARAAGADDILENAVTTNHISQALENCHTVFACSARRRHLSWPLITPKQCAEQVIQHIQQDQKIAILLGNEQSGLDNDIFKYCHFQVQIPGNPDYMSLNLAAAVQIIVYEIYCAAQQHSPQDFAYCSPTQAKTKALATNKELQGFYQHLEQVLWQIQFLNPEHPKRLMQRLYRLFNRAKLESLEINILRGILNAIERSKNNRSASQTPLSSNQPSKKSCKKQPST